MHNEDKLLLQEIWLHARESMINQWMQVGAHLQTGLQ